MSAAKPGDHRDEAYWRVQQLLERVCEARSNLRERRLTLRGRTDPIAVVSLTA